MSDVIFDDDEDLDDVVFLSADNKADMLDRFARPYRFPAEGERPPEGFYVRMATVDQLKKFERAESSKNKKQQLAAASELIADSVVDPSGDSVWTTDEIEDMGQANFPRFMRLQWAVLHRNGMATIDQLVEDSKKN